MARRRREEDMEMEYGARSDIGRVRTNNEDSFRTAPEMNLFILSDGMGGQASGEVASRLAVDTVFAHCREGNENPALPIVGEAIAGASEMSVRLASAIHQANRVLYEAAQHNPAHCGMGATIVAAWLAEDRICLAHVGDSRAYRLRYGELEQLTDDHSFVAEQVRQGILSAEEASQSNLQNVLLRALGTDPEVKVEISEELLVEGDTFLLCSDGLTHELSDAQIAGVLGEREGADEAADCLVRLANEAGGQDNITIIVLRYAPKPVGALARIGRWFQGS